MKTEARSKRQEAGRKKNLRIKSLVKILKKHSGRTSGGMLTVRGQGGRQKRYYREIDFKRNKFGVEGEVLSIDYDPNRNCKIALIKYKDGKKSYILAAKDMKKGDTVIAGEKTENKSGNAMRLKNITVGAFLHNVELTPGRGGQLGRSAGALIQLLAKEAGFAHLKLSSGEIRMVPLESMATIGSVGNEDYRHMVIGKAGRSRHMGIRPTVRGTAQDPDSHPHGGGEGRSGVGRKKPMTKYGKPAVGNTRRSGKRTGKYILQRRNKK